MTRNQPDWTAFSHENPPRIETLFDNSDRLKQFAILADMSGGEMYFDFSKTHLDEAMLSQFLKLADAQDFLGMRTKLLTGEHINVTEDRAAEHVAERGTGAADSVDFAHKFHIRMRTLVESIHAGALSEIRHVLHIGIGGSALGPDLVIDALGREDARCHVEVVSNVDGAALEDAFSRLDPQTTLIAVASKTFTTTETLMNANSALQWLREAGVEDAYGRVVALTASPDKAVEWGVDESRVLPFSESVGGRYSVWSSIGFPVAMALGWSEFDAFLRGAAAMDKHFAEADPARNAPVLAAFCDLYYAQVRNAQTRAVFAYDERLRLLPSYLQQLEMESNGKSVTSDGEAVRGPTAPITWGGVGTDAQHAVFQLLHQGTHVLPVEFVAAKTPGHDLDAAHHQTLLTNCFAQGAALMTGRASDDGAQNYAGDRPSSTILLDDVTAGSLGALIAFYEHRTFVNAVMLGINPFDQFGVELGKQIAKAMSGEGEMDFDPSTQKLIELAAL